MKFRLIQKFVAFCIALIACTGSVMASGGAAKKEAFNAKDVILHHVLDAHEIHFMTLGEGTENETHVSLPLPIILYSKERGLDFFLSSKFHGDQKAFVSHHDEEAEEQNGHELEVVPAYNGYAMVHEHIYFVDENNHVTDVQPLDLSITKTVLGVFITMLVLILVMFKVAGAYKKSGVAAPKGLQNIIEVIIVFIRDEVAKPSIGKGYEKFMPFLLTVFFFILIANFLGLIPFIGGFNVTGNISVALVLAVATFIVTITSAKKDYWMHLFWTPGVPVWLKLPLPLMFVIELVGVLSKPVVLCLRLFANITAGHIIILSFVSLIFIFGEKFGVGAGYGVSVLSVFFAIFMNVMEVLVAFLQAFVFTLLAAIYFGQAVEEHAHDDHAHAEHH